MTPKSIIEVLIKNQKEKGAKISIPKETDRIGFVFSTKDRVDFSLCSLSSLDQEKGFDVIWVDGSDTKEGKELPYKYKFKNANLVEIHSEIKGGPDRAIKYGLKRLLDLGYDYCGLIENDIVFQPGWFKKLIELFSLAAKDGLAVGAATVRNYNSRVIEYREKYTINWNIGAGMILFTRRAAELILDKYDLLPTVGLRICRFYGELFGVDLRKNREPCSNPLGIGYLLSCDFSYDMVLYKNGLASVGSIPSLVFDLGFDAKKHGLSYVSEKDSNLGILLPPISKSQFKKLILIEFSLLFIWKIWKIFKKIPWIHRLFRFIKLKFSLILKNFSKQFSD
jgi:hypothetical protein